MVSQHKFLKVGWEGHNEVTLGAGNILFVKWVMRFSNLEYRTGRSME